MDLTTLIEAALLGVIEGLTEFIPVSSTGHLIVASEWMGFEGPPGKVFNVFIQLGAVLAVCWHYRAKLVGVVKECMHNHAAQDFIAKIVVATLPAGFLGLLFHHQIKDYLFNPPVVALSLIIGGLLILLIERQAHRNRFMSLEAIPYRLVLLIGFVQALALIPGVSRSGATIMGALMLGVERKAATEFSFFLAIPALGAAAMFDIIQNYSTFTADDIFTLILGLVSAFFSALLVIRWLLHFVSRHTFTPFAWYRIALGLLILGLLAA